MTTTDPFWVTPSTRAARPHRGGNSLRSTLSWEEYHHGTRSTGHRPEQRRRDALDRTRRLPDTARRDAQRAGFQNSATGAELGFYAARSYSLMRPPRTSRRLIRWWERSATG